MPGGILARDARYFLRAGAIGGTSITRATYRSRSYRVSPDIDRDAEPGLQLLRRDPLLVALDGGAFLQHNEIVSPSAVLTASCQFSKVTIFPMIRKFSCAESSVLDKSMVTTAVPISFRSMSTPLAQLYRDGMHSRMMRPRNFSIETGLAKKICR